MHVEGELTLTLKFLLLGRHGTIALGLESLGQQFLDTTSSRDILQTCVCLFDHSLTEGTKTQLDHRSVVQDLRGDVCLVNGFLQMGHQEHIACNKEPVVKSVMVDMVEHSPGALQRVGVLVQIHTEVVDQVGGVLDGRGNVLGQECCGGILDSNNDHIGLRKNGNDVKGQEKVSNSAENWQLRAPEKASFTLKYRCSKRLVVVRQIASICSSF